MIVACPKCGAKNRIPDVSEPGERYRCGKCKTRLTLTPKAPVAEDERGRILQVVTAHKGVYVFLLLIVIVGVFSAFYHSLPRVITYSDIRPFYTIAVEPGLPYINKLIEYPVLTGLFIHVAGVLGQSLGGYYLLSSFVLISFATIGTYFLYRTIQQRDEKGLFTYWIFAPSMFFFLVYNWDIMPILFVVIALYFIKQDRDYLASLFLALGFCCKFYPVIYMLPLLLRRGKISEWIKIAGVFGFVTLAINIPFMLSNFEGWYYFISFSSERFPNNGSIWAVVNALVPQLSITQINMLSLFLFATSSIIVVWKYRHQSTIKLCFIMTLIFLIFNKVFSPQFLLWLLPFYVLLPMRKRGLFYALEVSNLIVLFTGITYSLATPQEAIFLTICRFFVVVRHIVLVYLLFDLLGWTSRVSIKCRALRASMLHYKSSSIRFVEACPGVEHKSRAAP